MGDEIWGMVSTLLIILLVGATIVGIFGRISGCVTDVETTKYKTGRTNISGSVSFQYQGARLDSLGIPDSLTIIIKK